MRDMFDFGPCLQAEEFSLAVCGASTIDLEELQKQTSACRAVPCRAVPCRAVLRWSY